jgi:hypothetical protein
MEAIQASGPLCKMHGTVAVVVRVAIPLLEPAAGRLRAIRAVNPKRDPKKPCVYLGMTG